MVITIILVVAYVLGFCVTGVCLADDAARFYKSTGIDPDTADGAMVVIFSLVWPFVWLGAGIGWVGKKIISWASR